MRHLARLYEQTTSTKVITRPSQDPLIASRSLRFRSRLSGIEQHQRNVESGHAWMNVTEAAFMNLVRGEYSIFAEIKDELLRADDSGAFEDKLIMLTAVRNLMHQIGLDMNQTYAGRFVFSGWQTEQPPILMRDQVPSVNHVITQTLNIQDIEQTLAFQRIGTEMPVSLPVHILKLPFSDSNLHGAPSSRNLSFGTELPAVDPPGFAVASFPTTAAIDAAVPRPISMDLGIFHPDGVTPFGRDVGGVHVPFTIMRVDPGVAGAFAPAPDAIHYIPETGELVLGSEAVAAFRDGMVFRYHVSNLREGDLNPWVYFDTFSSVDRIDTNVPSDPNSAPIRLPGVSNHWPSAERQPILYEFNHGSPVQVNSKAKNVYTAQLFADLQRLIDFAFAMTPPDRRELEVLYSTPIAQGGLGLTGQYLINHVDRRMADEEALSRYVLNNRIDNMLRLMDRHTTEVSREHTDLGNRMRRVEMFEIRLEQDEGNITQLKSENEDVDMTWALIQQSIGEAAFQGALRVIANNVQLSLVQFV